LSGASPDRGQYSSEIISLPQKFRYLPGLSHIGISALNIKHIQSFVLIF